MYALLFAALLVIQENEYGSTNPDLTIAEEVQENTRLEQARQIEMRTDRLGRQVRRVARRMVRRGKMTPQDYSRLETALISPSFRERVEDLMIVQLRSFGFKDLPINDETERVERANIDWGKLISFIEKIMPYILQLLELLSHNQLEGAAYHV